MSDKKQQLMDMGFEAARAEEALSVCDDNVERAIEYLFSGPPSDPPPSSSAATTSSSSSRALSNHQDVVASISQYSLDQGRSACTCIALQAADCFLQQAADAAYDNQNESPEARMEALQCLKTEAAAGASPQR